MKLQLFAASVILACLAATSAAAESPSIVLFEKPAAGNIKTIGIVTMAMPIHPATWHMGGLSEMGGLLTGVIEQGFQSARQKEFWKTIDGDNHPPQTTFANALTTALQADGLPSNRLRRREPARNS
jgi:hypothetical protein